MRVSREQIHLSALWHFEVCIDKWLCSRLFVCLSNPLTNDIDTYAFNRKPARPEKQKTTDNSQYFFFRCFVFFALVNETVQDVILIHQWRESLDGGGIDSIRWIICRSTINKFPIGVIWFRCENDYWLLIHILIVSLRQSCVQYLYRSFCGGNGKPPKMWKKWNCSAAEHQHATSNIHLPWLVNRTRHFSFYLVFVWPMVEYHREWHFKLYEPPKILNSIFRGHWDNLTIVSVYCMCIA